MSGLRSRIGQVEKAVGRDDADGVTTVVLIEGSRPGESRRVVGDGHQVLTITHRPDDRPKLPERPHKLIRSVAGFCPMEGV